MGDDIGLGSVTIDDILSCTELHYGKNQNKRNPNRCHHPLITQLSLAEISGVTNLAIYVLTLPFSDLNKIRHT